MAQSQPKEGRQDVTPLVIADLETRTAEGIRKYGRPLQAFNGRRALQDAYEEALDLVQYLKQALLEEEARCCRWVRVHMPVCCLGCNRPISGTPAEPATVVMSQNGAWLGFFCKPWCAGRQPDEVLPLAADEAGP